jgi:endo-1,4-beta-xylanase
LLDALMAPGKLPSMLLQHSHSVIRRICSLMVVALSCFPAIAENGAPIPLWPNGAPGSEGKSGKELVEQWNNGESKVSNIHNPSLTPYLPSKDKSRGAAVIVIPGGAHRFLAIDHEGYNVARSLSDHGIAAFVLKNRLARETNSTYKVEVHGLGDTQRAIRLVRSRASEWGIDPAHVGVLGFSAGGELAALAAMRPDPALPLGPDAIDQQNSKPNFQALIYPGGSKNIIATKDSPPAFLACAYDDRPDISEGLATVYLNFKKAGVPAELHIYSTGGHGFGFRSTNKKPVANWLVRFEEWLGDSGFLRLKAF